MKRFSARMRLTFSTTVELEAEDASDALRMFKAGEWNDDGMAGAELIDWTHPVAVKEES